jgi:hypothetical protein
MLDQHDSGSTSTTALWWPVIGASVVIVAFSIAVSVVRIFQVYPHDPWESIIIADAYRASVGLPGTRVPEIDHSTHIYGPLITYTIGQIFRLTGVNLIAGHLVPLVATIWIDRGACSDLLQAPTMGFHDRRGGNVDVVETSASTPFSHRPNQTCLRWVFRCGADSGFSGT